MGDDVEVIERAEAILRDYGRSRAVRWRRLLLELFLAQDLHLDDAIRH
ncbi:hypothetical protein [Demequina silvatica]|nr:hypothetical protein [Demequina silvatica]